VKKLIASILILCSSLLLFGNNPYDFNKTKHWFFFPLVAYGEETSFVYGGVIIYDTAKQIKGYDGQWTNVVQHSLKSQFRYITKAKFSIGDNYYTSIAYRYRNWPSDIFEFGNNSHKDSEMSYTEIQNSVEFDFYRQVIPDLYIGINSELGYLEVTKREETQWVDWDNLLGNEGGYFNGVGLVAKYDTRNQKNYPTEGLFYRASYRKYDEMIGADYNFSMLEIDFKNFISKSDNFVLATHLDGKFCDGNTPFQRLAKLGDRLRGYASRRFMDKHRVSARAELRMLPFTSGIQKRAGFVLFAETGQVANTLDDINIEDFKYSLGTGFRYQLTNSSDRLNMRFDIAFTEEGHSINVSAYEEF
jgi:hypothetical protein